MRNWFKRLLIWRRIGRIDNAIQLEEIEQEKLQGLRWLALDEQDNQNYHGFTRLAFASDRAVLRLKNQRDELVQQLERL